VFVLAFRIVTLAPTTLAPEESVTFPITVAVVSCAKALKTGRVKRAQVIAMAAQSTIFPLRLNVLVCLFSVAFIVGLSLNSACAAFVLKPFALPPVLLSRLDRLKA